MAEQPGAHEDEPHEQNHAARLNWLRAGVLGANDGIVSTAGLVIGVAAATTERAAILTAGLAGLAAGAMSMAAGEYVSVSTQRDTEQHELREMPEEELAELADLYEARGLSPDLAHQVALQLTQHDALAAHAEVELGIDPEELTNPWHAAWASMAAFTVGALLPLAAILLSPPGGRVAVTAASVVVALALTGWLSATLGGARLRPAVLRNVAGGVLAMVVTYAIGSVVGLSI